VLQAIIFESMHRIKNMFRQKLWVHSFMQSLLHKVLFYLCLRPMNNEDRMTPYATMTA